jgi:hypothetical protein
VDDFEPLGALTSLQSLWLDGTNVSDLSPLRGLTGLQSLRLDGTHVSDLEPLGGLAGLVVLDCGSSPVRDVAPLTVLPKLTGLRVRAQAIDWQTVDRFRSLKRLYVDGEVSRPPPARKRRGLQIIFNGGDFAHVADDLLRRDRAGRRPGTTPPLPRSRPRN